MIQMVLTALILVTTLTAACGNERPPAVHDEAVLVELQQVLATAWVDGDRATVEQIIAPEWTSTGPDGRTTDRATVLGHVFETGAHKIRRLEIDDVKARVFGEAAVVTGRTHGMGEFEGSVLRNGRGPTRRWSRRRSPVGPIRYRAAAASAMV